MTQSHRQRPTTSPDTSSTLADAGPLGGDAGIIARLRDGDTATYDALFRAHYSALCRFAVGYVCSAEVAEDVVQDVLYRIWQRRALLEVRTTLRAFLYALVRNRALNEVRHQRIVERHAASIVAGTMSAPEDNVLADDIARGVATVLAGLPSNAQRAYRLRFEDHLSYAEIAEAMGLSVKRIESLLRQVRVALRDGLAPYL